MVSELADENAGSAKIGKLNVFDNMTTASEFGILGVPTLVVFKNGEAVQRIQGLQPKAKLQAAIDAAKA